MKELVVISGKGGTGKTSILAAFASLAKGKVLCDADVDAAGPSFDYGSARSASAMILSLVIPL